MAEDVNRKLQRELNAGAVALVVLRTFERADRPMYGYELAKRLEELARGTLPMNQGALYPVLRSLEKTGLLASEMTPSAAGPPRRYYRITSQGRQALGDWIEAWRRIKEFVDAVLEGHHVDSRSPAPPGGSRVPGVARAGAQKGAGPDPGRRTGRRSRVPSE